MKNSILFCFAVLLSGIAAYASADGTPLSPPALELRAQELFKAVRCVVCEGQSIHDSGAVVAHDMRNLIRSQLQAGKSEAEIKSYLVERYGEAILMTPPLSSRTAVLWAAPALFLLSGGVFAFFSFTRKRRKKAL